MEPIGLVEKTPQDQSRLPAPPRSHSVPLLTGVEDPDRIETVEDFEKESEVGGGIGVEASHFGWNFRLSTLKMSLAKPVRLRSALLPSLSPLLSARAFPSSALKSQSNG